MSLVLPRDFEAPYGEVEQVSPRIRRVLAENPGPFTFRGTGTYIVGRGEVAVIDPGPDQADHAYALGRALAGETVTHIFVTHTHRDHSPLAKALQKRTGAVVYAFGPHPAEPELLDETPEEGAVTTEEPYDAEFSPDVSLSDGEVVEGPGWTIEAVYTPGHISNHLCFGLREERALFSGDHVMGWSTTVIAPPLGDMAAYFASLAKVRDRGDEVFWPTHGHPIHDPAAHVTALIEHRRDRERQVLARLAAGDRTITEIVAALYADVDEKLHKAAGRSVLAHLLQLRAEGRVRAEGPLGHQATWRVSQPS